MLPALEFGKAFFEIRIVHAEIVEEPLQSKRSGDKIGLRQITQVPMAGKSCFHQSRFTGTVTTQQTGDPADRNAEPVQVEFGDHVTGIIRVTSKIYKAMSKANVAVQS